MKKYIILRKSIMAYKTTICTTYTQKYHHHRHHHHHGQAPRWSTAVIIAITSQPVMSLCSPPHCCEIIVQCHNIIFNCPCPSVVRTSQRTLSLLWLSRNDGMKVGWLVGWGLTAFSAQ